MGLPSTGLRELIAREKTFAGRRLSRAPRAGKKISVADISRFYLIFERSHHKILSDDFIEGLRSEFAVKRKIAHFTSL